MMMREKPGWEPIEYRNGASIGMKARVQRTSVIFMKRSAELTLIKQRLSRNACSDATNVPTAQIGEVHLIELCTAKGDVGGTGQHCSFAVSREQRYLSIQRHTIHVMRSVAGDIEIAGGIKRSSVRDIMQPGCIHTGFPGHVPRVHRNSQDVILSALDHK